MLELSREGGGGQLSVVTRNTPPTAPHYPRLTIQVIGRVEGVQSLLTPLHEGVLLALHHPLEQLQQLFFFFYLLINTPTQRVAN